MKDFSNTTVLQIIPALDTGGAERTTLEVSKALIDAGGRSIVFSRGGRLVDELKGLGAEFIAGTAHTKNPFFMAANARKISEIIRSKNVNIVHARSRAPAWSALWASRATKTPFVTTYHGAYRSGNPLKRFYNSSMTRADRIIANSEFTAAAVLKNTKVDKTRLVVIPRGADAERFDPRRVTQNDIQTMRKAWGIPTESVCFLLPARITEWKGQLVAVEAFARVCSEIPSQSYLVLAGDDQGRSSFREELERAVAAIGDRDKIRLVGHVDDMPTALASADIVLSPAIRPEAFGRVAAEAGAMERIVIAANHGGARETVIDGKTGYLVDAGDAQSLAEAMRDAVALSVEKKVNLQKEARSRIVQHYSISSMTSATLDVYAELAQPL